MEGDGSGATHHGAAVGFGCRLYGPFCARQRICQFLGCARVIVLRPRRSKTQIRETLHLQKPSHINYAAPD
jgi:hypothetical protein